MPNQKIVTEAALSAIASDIKNALSGKANSNDVYLKSQTYNKTEIDNALNLKADKSELYNVYPTEQESGAIAHFTDGADNIPVKSLVSEIVAVQSGSGTPSPSNHRAISGFDSGIITRCGKNVIDTRNIDVTIAGIHALSDNNGIISLSGTRDTSSGWKVIKTFTDLPIGNYVFSINNSHITCLLNYTQKTSTFTVNKGDVVRLALNISSGTVVSDTNIKVQIEVGDTASEFEQYNGNNYTFEFGQTIYGGRFDNKGNLVVTHKIVDLGTLTWVKDTNRTDLFRTPSLDGIKANGNTNYICDSYPVVNVSLSSLPDKSTRGYPSYGYIYVCDSTYHTAWENNTPDDFKTGVNGVYIVYELKTPIVLPITSQDIPTLLGENNIFSNCGDVEVNYHADIGLYIDKKISSLAQA